MKKILTMIFLSLYVLLISAENINSDIAKIVAKNFMDKQRGGSNAVLDYEEEKRDGQTTLFIVNFTNGGWVMVSATKSTRPVLGVSLTGTYRVQDEKPGAFNDLVDLYTSSISKVRNLRSANKEIDEKWDALLSSSNLRSTTVYIPAHRLLNVPNRGQIEWSQSANYSGTCTPSLNAFCGSSILGGGVCDHYKVGCAGVAMGQIMWYWRWPLSSSYRSYDWALMPSTVGDGTPVDRANQVAHLLADLSIRSSTVQGNDFSWTDPIYLIETFKAFNYNGVRKYQRTEFGYGAAWNNLIRSEIDAERPVFYYGEYALFSGDKHYFIIDGYIDYDHDLFYMNFGCGESNSNYNLSAHPLTDITPGDDNFNANQFAIVGISPTFVETIPSSVNISGVSYTTVTGTKSESAQYNISVPAANKALTIQSGANYTLNAGEQITLNPGFKALSGSNLNARINPTLKIGEMDMSVPNWLNVLYLNQPLQAIAKNANSWECKIFTIGGSAIYQNAGFITNDTITIWDGSGTNVPGWYSCTLTLKNNFGRILDKTYLVQFNNRLRSADVQQDSLAFLKDATLIVNNSEGRKMVVFPNPSSDYLIISVVGTLNKVDLFNSLGQKVQSVVEPKGNSIDVRSLPNGVYFIHAFVNDVILESTFIKD